jgi:hypothetical protein
MDYRSVVQTEFDVGKLLFHPLPVRLLNVSSQGGIMAPLGCRVIFEEIPLT